MKGLKNYLTEIESMQFVANPAKAKDKKDAASAPGPVEPAIEYHSAEDSANFWMAARNPLGGRDLSHLTPEEFVAELTKDQ